MRVTLYPQVFPRLQKPRSSLDDGQYYGIGDRIKSGTSGNVSECINYSDMKVYAIKAFNPEIKTVESARAESDILFYLSREEPSHESVTSYPNS
jgi:hypothetical protein